MKNYEIEITCTDKTIIIIIGAFSGKHHAMFFADKIILQVENEGKSVMYQKIKLKK